MWCVAQAQAAKYCSKQRQAKGFYPAGNGNVSGGFLCMGVPTAHHTAARRPFSPARPSSAGHAGRRAGIHAGDAGWGNRGTAAETNAQGRAGWMPHQVRHDVVGLQPCSHGLPNRRPTGAQANDMVELRAAVQEINTKHKKSGHNRFIPVASAFSDFRRAFVSL